MGALPDEILADLCRLYLKYWHDTGAYECDAGHSRYSYIDNSDMTDMDDICVRIESRESAIRKFLEKTADASRTTAEAAGAQEGAPEG